MRSNHSMVTIAYTNNEDDNEHLQCLTVKGFVH